MLSQKEEVYTDNLIISAEDDYMCPFCDSVFVSSVGNDSNEYYVCKNCGNSWDILIESCK